MKKKNKREKILRIVLIILIIIVVSASLGFIYLENNKNSMGRQEALQIAIHSKICNELNLTTTAYQEPKTGDWWIYPEELRDECSYYCVVLASSQRAVIKEKCTR